MELKKLSRFELETDTMKWVRTERKVIHIVLAHLLELSARKIYSHYEYDGMYTYMTKKLGYSGPAASLRLKALELLKSTPQMADKIENQTVCLSQMAQLQTAINMAKNAGQNISCETTLQILEQIEKKSTFETKAILARELDLPLMQHESVKPQKDSSVRLEITLTREQFADLEQSKNLLSHICPNAQWSDVIATLVSKFNTQRLVGRPAKRGVTPSVSASDVKSEKRNKVARPRTYISVRVKRSLFQRANGCCEYKDLKTGFRCTSKFQLQIDHIKPWAFGGGNEFGNLRILCRKHNVIAAEKLGLNRTA